MIIVYVLMFLSVLFQEKPVPMPKAPVPVNTKEHLMIFGAEWCPACVTLRSKMVASPRLQTVLRTKFADKITRIDVDKDATLKKEFDVKVIPTMIVYKIEDGKNVEIRRVTGDLPVKELLDFLKPEVEHFDLTQGDKMNERYTDITFVIDRSGSMQDIAKDMEGGIANFLKQQNPSSEDDKCLVTIYQFDTDYEKVVENTPVQKVKPYKLLPRNMTALLDAVGKTINNRGAYFASLPENERPGKVILLIVTDGNENRSTEFKKEQIAKMVAHQKSVYNWEFVFIGADLASFADAQGMQIKSANQLGVAKTPKAIADLWNKIGTSSKTYRSYSQENYIAQVSNEERGFFQVEE